MIRIFPSELSQVVDSRVYKRLLEIYDLIYSLSERIDNVPVGQITRQQISTIKKELQAGGSDPLNVQALLGVLAQAQVGGAPSFASFPVPADPRSQDGALGVLAGSPATLYRYDQVSRTWIAIGAIGFVDFEHGSVSVGSRAALNFVDGGVVWTLTDDAINARVDVSGAVQAYTTVEDEGIALTQRTTMNFVGAGVTAADSGGKTVVTIPGAAGGTVTTTGSPASGNLTKFSGAATITNGDLSGDVTTAGTLVATIANDAVTYAKMQNVSAASRLLGRGSAAGSGDVQEITLGSNMTMSGTTLSASGGTIVGSALGLIEMIREVNYLM